MKKLTLITATFLMCLTACAREEPIALANLPNQAQSLINTYFADLPVALTKVDHDGLQKTYEVIFTTGGSIEFNHNGEWKNIEISTGVPMELIPEAIVDYLKANYPNQIVIQIDRDIYDYELQLDNGVELKFNKKYQLIDIDY
jgi:hypothetical protein